MFCVDAQEFSRKKYQWNLEGSGNISWKKWVLSWPGEDLRTGTGVGEIRRNSGKKSQVEGGPEAGIHAVYLQNQEETSLMEQGGFREPGKQGWRGRQGRNWERPQ